MEKEALEYLLNLRPVELLEEDGLRFSTKSLFKVPQASPDVFKTKSLASIVDLINKESGHERLGELIIHVESPTQVYVYTTLRQDLERFCLYSAMAELPTLSLGKFLDVEEMNILLKSAFATTDARERLVALLGNIQEENIKTTSDDGFSQKVTAKTGIGTLSKIKVDPIVSLAPYRTFIEVNQPEGEFLLRLQSGPKASLFEADGGAWKIQARKNIKAYFSEYLGALIDSGKVIVTE